MGFKNSKKIDGVFDVAVVIPTVVRPSLLEAVRSIFEQNYAGSIQILIGVDKMQGEQSTLDALFEGAPDRVTISLFDPQYSTSIRHGGIHEARDGGSLRTSLSFLANSRYVAYLDDDNLWHPNHLETLLKAVEGVDWAYSYRWLVDDTTNMKLTVDKWHSVGPNKGIMKGTSGGFADPNTILIDKLACADQLHLWSVSSIAKALISDADRMFFDGLSLNKTHRSSKRATTYYRIRKTNILWQHVNREAYAKEKLVN